MSRRKREVRRGDAPAQAPWVYRALIVVAGIGVAISGFLAYHHFAGAPGEGGLYGRFCGGQGSYVNCDAVLSSPYATVFGLPLALWAAGAYIAAVVLTVLRWTGVLALLAAFSLGFSLYLAGVSLLVIHALCFFCGVLYIVNGALLVLAVHAFRRSGRVVTRKLGYGAAAVVLGVSALGWWQAAAARRVAPPGAPSSFVRESRDDLRAAFLRWYRSRPTVALGGRERHVEGRAGAAVTVVEFVDFL